MGPRGAEGAAREVVLLGVDLHLVPGLVVVEVPELEDHRQRLFALREAVPEPRAEELSQLFLPPLGGGQHPRQVPVPMRALAFGRLLPDLPLDLRRVARRCFRIFFCSFFVKRRGCAAGAGRSNSGSTGTGCSTYCVTFVRSAALWDPSTA